MSEIEFPPTAIKAQRYLVIRGDRRGAVCRAAQIGRDHLPDGQPGRSRTGCPHPIGENFTIRAAKQPAGERRLAVPHQVKIDRRRHASETPASAKLAIWSWVAIAARTTPAATAAPLPSPNRISKERIGLSPSRSSSRAWPGSAEQ